MKDSPLCQKLKVLHQHLLAPADQSAVHPGEKFYLTVCWQDISQENCKRTLSWLAIMRLTFMFCLHELQCLLCMKLWVNLEAKLPGHWPILAGTTLMAFKCFQWALVSHRFCKNSGLTLEELGGSRARSMLTLQSQEDQIALSSC